MSTAQRKPSTTAKGNFQTDLAAALESEAKLDIVERVSVPPRPEKLSAVPDRYRSSKTGARLRALLPPSRKLWSHQALALEKLDEGENVLVTTGTGSGKSMIFQLPILREMLQGKGTALVLYPQKALGSDQLRRWKSALEQVGIDPELVGEINGNVPTVEREPIVERARILLATPDVAHSWLQRHLKMPSVQRFLSRLTYTVVDEAHAYHGVMGSNSAYLFRRLRMACKRAADNPEHEPRFIVASATLDDAENFAHKLVGLPFEHIGEDQDGSPRHGLTLLHAEGPDHGAAGEAALADILRVAKRAIDQGSFLAFADARQGVERICRNLQDDKVLPYRSGYEHSDRLAIETVLHSGELTGCVATSALELGIDVAGFRTGFNMGVPASRMTLRQRVGRVGRSSPGVFIVIAPGNAFAKLGTTLDEFYFGPVEPSHVYLGNELIQYQQARCVLEEIGGPDELDQAFKHMVWPLGFADALKRALPGARLPSEVARIAQQCGNSPHLSYPLRRINDLRMDLRLARNGDKIGDIGVEQALKEAYPGATYYHYRRAYRVLEWRVSSFGNAIILEPQKICPPTSGILYTQIGYALDDDQVINCRHVSGSEGAMLEGHLRVTESAIGYAIAGKQRFYSDLSKSNPKMRRQMRMFETTGVILRLGSPAFAGSTPSFIEKRKKVGEAIRAILTTSHGLQTSEIGLATSGVSQFSHGQPEKDENAIVLYDDIQGGLRLTEVIYSDFLEVLDRLLFATELAGSDSMLDERTIDELHAWYDGLKSVGRRSEIQLPQERKIFAPGSMVGAMMNGQLCERELLGHDHLEMGGQEMLMYRYDAGDGVAAWIAADALHPIGDKWRYLSSPQAGDQQ